MRIFFLSTIFLIMCVQEASSRTNKNVLDCGLSTWDGQQCVFCPEGCVCQQGKCIDCDTGYYIHYDGETDNIKQCIRCPNGCESCCFDDIYMKTITCMECKYGYYYIQGMCKKCGDPDNDICLQCENSTACQKCAIGYYLNKGFCKACKTQNCGACIPGEVQVCTACLDSYFSLNGVCEIQCDPNCITCRDTSNCQICREGYQMNLQNKCIKVIACEKWNVIDQQCTLCADGYYLDKTGFCQDCSVNQVIKRCDGETGNIYIQCYPDYTLIKNNQKITCQENKNCLLQSNDLQCLSCYDPYFISNGECITCTNLHISCQQCTQGSAADFVSSCTQCGDGFFQFSDGCASCSENCIKCEQIECPDCAVGDYLTECTTCDQGYYVDFSDTLNSCKNCGDFCESCVDGSICKQCIDNYILSDDKSSCLRCADVGCISCDVDGFCSLCYPGYFLVLNAEGQGSCQKCPRLRFCQQCLNSTHCQSCIGNDFYLDQNSQCINEGCLRSESGTKCQLCMNGFQFHNNKCEVCDGTDFIDCPDWCPFQKVQVVQFFSNILTIQSVIILIICYNFLFI